MTPRLGLLILGIAALILNSSIGRPIWIDETAEFGMAAFSSSGEAWRAFVGSIASLNHGQTGAYYMLGHWLMRWFGANVFILRLPAMFYGAWLLVAAIYLFEVLELPVKWRYFGLMAFFCHPWISDYFAEARPYIILAAANVGTLAYYMTPLEKRTSTAARLVGFGSVVSGALFHPYFSVYWLLCSLIGYVHLSLAAGRPVAVFRHLNLVLCVLGTAIYFGIGGPTWLSHPAGFGGFDPFLWIPKQWSVGRYLYATHFLFLRMFKIPLTLAFGAAAFGIFFHPRLKRSRNDLLVILVILATSLSISALLSYISYRARYWILERQWIGSIALVIVATVWFCAAAAKRLPTRWQARFTNAALALITVNSLAWVYMRIDKMVFWHQHPDTFVEITEKSRIEDVKSWENLARANCVRGGPVWPEFRKMFE